MQDVGDIKALTIIIGCWLLKLRATQQDPTTQKNAKV